MCDYLQGKSDHIVNGEESEFDIDSFIKVWLEETVKTNTPRRRDICNDKRKSVLGFFLWIGKSPEMTLPIDVRNWLVTLKRKKLALTTIYSRLSALSSFFEFLRSNTESAFNSLANPVKDNMPKRPRAFRKDSVNVLSAQDLSSLLDVIKKYTLSGRPLHLRDYAMLQVFVVTGWSRQEVLGLTGKNIKITEEDILLINPKGKNPLNSNFELNDKIAKNSLLAYLKVTRRDEKICGTTNPLWLRHDNSSKNIQNPQLTSHAFAIRMKFYADCAGIKNFHLHKLRWICTTVITKEWALRNNGRKTTARKELCDTNFNAQRVRIIENKFSNLLYKRAFGYDKKHS